MAFVRFPFEKVHWSTPPAVFASSSLVERGFCRDCGTPLTYRRINGPNISLTLNSLDDPNSVQPEMAFSPEAKASWCETLAALPGREMEMTAPESFVNNQR